MMQKGLLALLAIVAVQSKIDKQDGWDEEIIPHECKCAWDASYTEYTDSGHEFSFTREVYCMEPERLPTDENDEPLVNDDGEQLYFCGYATKKKGVTLCDQAEKWGHYLCRNVDYCFADGEWPDTLKGNWATMECGAGFNGEQSRYCSPDGKWKTADRSGCTAVESTVYCGRGTYQNDIFCECEPGAVKWSANDDSGMSWSLDLFHGEHEGPAYWATAEANDMEMTNEAELMYCAPPPQKPFCLDEPGNEDCICPGGYWRQERASRSSANMQEWWCVKPEWLGAEEGQNCSVPVKECPGNNYKERSVGCTKFNGGMDKEGTYCDRRPNTDGSGNFEDYFWMLTDEARNCKVESECADVCGFGSPDDRRLLQSTAPIYVSESGKHRALTAGVACLAHSGEHVQVCEEVTDKDVCDHYYGCVPKEAGNTADTSYHNDVTACGRQSPNECATYTNKAHSEPFCEISTNYVCSWHVEGKDGFDDYCRAKDHWIRPALPCRSRHNYESCVVEDACEWITEDAAASLVDDLDRCNRYNDHRDKCESVNSCKFECNWHFLNAGRERDEPERQGQCEARQTGTAPECRTLTTDTDCWADPLCVWSFNNNCRCVTGEQEGYIVVEEEEPSAECLECEATACDYDEDSFECVAQSEFIDNNIFNCAGSGSGYECAEDLETTGLTCAFCKGVDTDDFFNLEWADTPVGERAYKFCPPGQRGIQSVRCLSDGGSTFWSETEDGSCVSVTCPSITGTNWEKTAAGTIADAPCDDENETGYLERPCYINGEWGEVTNNCEPQDHSCPLEKDQYGIWQEQEANSRQWLDCAGDYHGMRFRDCSEKGRWGPVMGECFPTCSDIVPRKCQDSSNVETCDNTLIVFSDRPHFIVDVSSLTENATSEILAKYTCGARYGSGDTLVIGLRDNSEAVDICNEKIAVDNCPQLCNKSECEDCRDSQEGHVEFTLDGKKANVMCSVIAENEGDNDWTNAGICDLPEAQALCPLSCQACGGACPDNKDGFLYKGEVHYCHEATDAFCGHHEFSDNCPKSCGLPCFADDEGDDEAACSEDDPSYLFQILGVEQAGFTDCAALATPNFFEIAAAMAPGTDLAICNIDRNDASSVAAFAPTDISYYANKPTPAEACPSACNAVDAAAFPCTPTCDESLQEGTYVRAKRSDGIKAGKITSRDEANCMFTVQFFDDFVESYKAGALLADVGECSCPTENRFGLDPAAEIACEDDGFCAGDNNGSCFAGEEICYF